MVILLIILKSENYISQTTAILINIIYTIIPNKEKTESISTTIPIIINTTSINTSINTIPATIIIKLPEAFEIAGIIEDEKTYVLLLGLSHIRLFWAYFTFYIYLTPTKHFLYILHKYYSLW